MAPINANTPIKSTGSRYNQKRSITPIIKIVHVNAPTLVRTDIANFRALVQEMTGNVAHANHNIKDINTDCSTQASTSNETINNEKIESKTRRRLCVSSKVKAHAHTIEDGYSSGASSLQGGIEDKRENEKRKCAISKGSYCNEEEEKEEGDVCVESSKSSCDRSVDSYFAESEEACVEDHLYNMQQQYCSAYFATNWSATNWRQPLEIPGGFEPFDYC